MLEIVSNRFGADRVHRHRVMVHIEHMGAI